MSSLGPKDITVITVALGMRKKMSLERKVGMCLLEEGGVDVDSKTK